MIVIILVLSKIVLIKIIQENRSISTTYIHIRKNSSTIYLVILRYLFYQVVNLLILLGNLSKLILQSSKI